MREWELSGLRNFALAVIFCCFVFSSVFNASVLSQLPPDDSFVDCLGWLGGNSSPADVVFAQVSDGFFIEFWAERKVLADEFYASDSAVGDLGRIWQSSDLNEVKRFFSRKGVKYVLVHEGLFSGVLPESEGKGLRFLLGNPETFKREYANSYCEVWKFKVNNG